MFNKLTFIAIHLSIAVSDTYIIWYDMIRNNVIICDVTWSGYDLKYEMMNYYAMWFDVVWLDKVWYDVT